MNFWRKGVGWEWIFVIARSLELQALPYALNRPPRAAASFNNRMRRTTQRPLNFMPGTRGDGPLMRNLGYGARDHALPVRSKYRHRGSRCHVSAVCGGALPAHGVVLERFGPQRAGVSDTGVQHG